MKYYLGIDIGTSGTKTVCFNELGEVMTSKFYAYDMTIPKPGYAEENPLDWFIATKETIRQVTKEGYLVSGIGLSGQMHGLVLLDKNDQILRPSIIWCDNRAINEAEELIHNFGNEKMKVITGNPVIPSFTLSKLLWVKRNEPELYKKIDKIMLPKDYVRYALTGSFTTEYSDASGMQMLDIHQKCFSKEILKYMELSLDKIPRLLESSEISGYIKKDLTCELGLCENCFVVGGAGDQAAAAIGNGIIERGDLSLVLGSSGVVFSPIGKDDVKDNPLQVFMHAVPNTYHIMGVTNGCGLSYKWLKESLFEKEDYNTLNEKANLSKPLANGLIYLPYLNGERTPHLDPYATGTFIGIRQNTKDSDIIRAVLEGVSYSLKDCYSLLPKQKYHIRASGGGAKGSLWRIILASTLNTSIERIVQDEGGALGVAILAMVADHIYPSIKAATDQIIKVLDVTEPNNDWIESYSKGYELYKEAYLSLKKYYKKAFEI
ncbi:MAG: xylulokinase [Roseburia sp.]|nr:xylulokinase [Anaeroplasma bactoclasticum]MCM1195961.1 xylulokinase [Roseburia sp.]MCM1555897.1 xylulokinase [Anaeroplasma bactoclasticum]